MTHYTCKNKIYTENFQIDKFVLKKPNLTFCEKIVN